MRRMRLDGAATPGATLAHEVIGPAGEVVAGAGYPLTRRTADAPIGAGRAKPKAGGGGMSKPPSRLRASMLPTSKLDVVP